MRDGGLTTFVVPAGPAVAVPTRLTTGWRIVRALPLEPPARWMRLRNYMLHTPCRTLVRDLYLDAGLWPDALPTVDFHLPGPSGTPIVDVEPGRPHFRRLNLTARIEQLPAGAAGLELEAASDTPHRWAARSRPPGSTRRACEAGAAACLPAAAGGDAAVAALRGAAEAAAILRRQGHRRRRRGPRCRGRPHR
ncbi:MAG: hypothetical protein MZW92_13910 [Comamonadaceae bacterium]|nr:hypothetical protein [Comamonadaceae bacterium]